jgi:RHS repeat-associated protein
MRIYRHLKTILLILLLTFMISGIASAKVASGLQNFASDLHQGQSVFNPLLHQEETKLVAMACQVPLFNYFRDYDPETGRYISSDPIGLAGGLNTYGYALQNPLSFTDPLGLNPVTGATVGAEVGTVILPGVGTVAGAVIGGIGGYLIADQLGSIIFAKPKPGSKPKNCPPGTKPIDQIPELRGGNKVHDIKRGVRAGPRDWTGITPDGKVITGDSEGDAVNHGPYDIFLP